MTKGQRGGGTVLTIAVLLMVLLVGWCGVALVGWMGSMRHARQAADLAALAGASARLTNADACAAARRVARANGAELTRCRVQGDLRDVVVTLEVRVALKPALRGAPKWAIGTATAGSLSR